MSHADHTFWLQPSEGGCGGCQPSAGAGACLAQQQGRPCERPDLIGDPALLARLISALREVADADGDLVARRRFSALRVAGGEAELVLTFPRDCGGNRLLAEAAFQVLRRELPDTDVFVLHAS